MYFWIQISFFWSENVPHHFCKWTWGWLDIDALFIKFKTLVLYVLIKTSLRFSMLWGNNFSQTWFFFLEEACSSPSWESLIICKWMNHFIWFESYILEIFLFLAYCYNVFTHALNSYLYFCAICFSSLSYLFLLNSECRSVMSGPVTLGL